MANYSKWTPNIKVEIWGSPVKLEKPENCPEPEKHKRCVDDNEDCPYFMGHAVTNKAFWGDELPACCEKLLDVALL